MKKIYKLIILLLFCGLISMNIQSQDLNSNKYYVLNPFVINPAAAGLQNYITGFIDFSQRIAGMAGAPESRIFGLDGMITSSMGLGLMVRQNKNGIFNSIASDLNYSFRISISENQTLALGISTGFVKNSLDLNMIKSQDFSDPTFSSNQYNSFSFNTGVGLHYTLKQLNLHISVPDFYNNKDNKIFSGIYSLLSYNFFVSEKLWRIEPIVLYKFTKPEMSEISLSVLCEWNNKAWLQIGYNSTQSVHAGIGIFIKNIGIGYTYEYYISKISTISSGAHEITLFYESPFTFLKKKPSYTNSRRMNAWD